MKTYPSIAGPGSCQYDFRAHVFDKLDGSNIRAEWTKKKSWSKFGSRNHLIDHTDHQFGEAVKVFMFYLAEPLERLAVDKKWKHLVTFFEFFGPQSFTGVHVKEDPKKCVLFDAAIDKKGIIGPKRFIEIFADLVETPKYLGEHNWTRGFVERVYEGDIEGISFEGVVGKAGDAHKLIIAKAKTRAWIQKVKLRYGEIEAKKIIES